jgi:hypothetical protein
MTNPTHNSRSSILNFTLKIGVIFLFFIILIDLIFPDYSDIHNYIASKNKIVADRINEKQNQFYLLGLIQNPVALYKSSEVHENNGRLDNAIRDMELALGLLEMHGSNQILIEKFKTRLNSLKKHSEPKP